MSVELTKREQEVIELVMDGMMYSAIGKKLGISERTVTMHVTNMKAKYGAVSVYNLIAKVCGKR